MENHHLIPIRSPFFQAAEPFLWLMADQGLEGEVALSIFSLRPRLQASYPYLYRMGPQFVS